MIRISRDNSKIRLFFLIILIASIVSAFNLILIINSGWIQSFTTAYFFSDFFLLLTFLAFGIVIIIIIVFFIYSTVLSIVSMIDREYLKPIKNYKLGVIFMSINFIAMLLIFIMIMIASMLTTYGVIFAAFFTGIPCFCSLLNFVLYLNIIKFLKKKS